MKKSVLVTFLIILSFCCAAQNQKLSGAQILRTARSIYEQGRLHELPVMLEDALKGRTFSKSEKVEAYKILILTYIYLEEPQKADNAMIHLLKTDHFFEINDAVDPVEFKSLYERFRTRPLFGLGLKLGIPRTFIDTKENHFIASESKGRGSYSSILALNYTAVFEKDLKNRFVAAPEIGYTTQGFRYFNEGGYYNDGGNENSSQEHNFLQNRVQLNALAQYKLFPTSRFNPYLSFGPVCSFLTQATIEPLTNYENNDNVESSAIDNKSAYKQFDLSLMASIGVKRRAGEFYLVADIRYQYGLMSIVEKGNRYNTDNPALNNLLFSNGFVNNKFSINQASINLGFIYPIFNPKKIVSK